VGKFTWVYLVILLSSCCAKNISTVQSNSTVPDNKLTAATVINYQVDGCNYLLQLMNGEKLEPVNLTEEYKKDQLKVLIKYHYEKDKMSVCMAGKIVFLDLIKLQKE
jgi:hypothetical protein